MHVLVLVFVSTLTPEYRSLNTMICNQASKKTFSYPRIYDLVAPFDKSSLHEYINHVIEFLQKKINCENSGIPLKLKKIRQFSAIFKVNFFITEHLLWLG